MEPLAARPARNMGNKAAEICITLITLYLVLELSFVPDGCSFSKYSYCLGQYVAAARSIGVDTDSVFITNDCGDTRMLCANGLAGDSRTFSSINIDDGATWSNISSVYAPVVTLCRCLGGAYCDFQAARSAFLFFAILGLFLFELSIEAFPMMRHAAYIYAGAFFLICLLTFNQSSMCNSQLYSQKRNVIVFLCVICLVILFAAWVIEMIAKRGKIDSFIEKRLNRSGTSSPSHASQPNSTSSAAPVTPASVQIQTTALLSMPSGPSSSKVTSSSHV
eukprot:m.237241 g.237241  ORF g.237241 m.237241 type:complete len:277 (-) comp21011_c0_seq1:23-853(-)